MRSPRCDPGSRPVLALVAVTAACGGPTDGMPTPDRQAMCDDIANVYECSRRVESLALDRGDAVVRRGDTLIVSLADGGEVRLVDRDAGGPGNVLYTYRGHLDRIGYHVVDVHYYEGGDHVLINERTGVRTTVPAPPVVSPDGQRLVVASAGGMAGYSPNALQVWRVPSDSLELEWELEPDWGAEEARWQDAVTVRFLKLHRCPDRPEVCATGAVLRLRDGDWEVDEP
ncbi:MAG: hypothetical protein ACOC5I_00610 [Gemmatimonadota bacterium]